MRRGALFGSAPGRGRGRSVAVVVVVGASLTALGCGASGGSSASTSTPESPLAGAWETVEYRLASGVTHAVRGRIFFSETDWTVLFFVVDAEGVPRRGSGEGGTYTLDGSDLVFTHLYHLSHGAPMEGLPAADLRMTARTDGGEPEPSSIELVGDRLEIRFPSGNAMTFRRRP